MGNIRSGFDLLGKFFKEQFFGQSLINVKAKINTKVVIIYYNYY